MTLKNFMIILYYFTQVYVNKSITKIGKLYCIKIGLSKMDLRME